MGFIMKAIAKCSEKISKVNPSDFFTQETSNLIIDIVKEAIKL